MKKLFIILGLMFFTGTFLSAQKWVEMLNEPNANFNTIQQEFQQYWEGKEITKGCGYKQFKRMEYFMSLRTSPDGQIPDRAKMLNSVKKYMNDRGQNGLKSATTGNWTPLGPDSHAQLPNGLGRVNTIMVDPNNSNKIFLGTPSGGLWISLDGGQTWSTNTDNFPTLGVGNIQIDPTNSNIIYISTGDQDLGTTSTTGVLKSTDGGITWNTTGLTFNTQESKRVYSLVIHPTNSNVLIASTSDGIYKTTNAAASWTLTDNSGSIYDIEFKPGNPAVIYASGSGTVMRSTNTGTSWTLLTSGLPTDLTGRTAIAVTAAAPQNLYFLTSENNNFRALFVSTNGGNSFTQSSGTVNFGSQAWYAMVLEVSPTNPDLVFVGDVYLYKSLDKGATWQSGTSNYVHADHHFLKYFGTTLYNGNDGGIYKTTDNGASWTDLSDGLNITQFYRIGGCPQDPFFIFGGSQDNGTSRFNNGVWSQILGSDGMETAIDYTNSNIVYATTQEGPLFKSTDGGNNFSYITGNISEPGPWVMPYVLDPVNPNTIYAGYNNLWKSTVGGNTWTQLTNFTEVGYVRDLAVAPSDPNYIYFIRNDVIHRTTNGGTTWTETTIPSYYTKTSIAIHESNPNTLWLAISSMNVNEKVYKSTDGGSTWTNISGTLPDVPVLDIVYQNGSNEALYIGTDLGVYYRDNSMTDWAPFMSGLPNVIVNELEIHYPSGRIRAATYGRGLWESPIYTDPTSSPVANFTANHKSGYAPLNVQFTDISLNLPTTWSWNFQGGTPATSNIKNPSVTFNTPGTYQVSLTVSNANGSDSETKVGYITASQMYAPVAQFYADVTVSEVYRGICYHDQSTNDPSSWSWTFEGGDPSTSNDQNPCIYYNTPGTYGVTLTVSNAVGGDTEVKSGYITVTELPQHFFMSNFTTTDCKGYLYDSGGEINQLGIPGPYANNEDFTFVIAPVGATEIQMGFKTWDVQAGFDFLYIYDGVNTSAPLIGQFSATSPGRITAMSGALTLRFVSDGSVVGLGWVSDWYSTGGSCNLAPPSANFSANPSSGTVGMTVNFSDLSTNGPTEWNWSFPGGTPNSSTAKNPSVVYNTAGTYDVSLLATNAFGSNTKTTNNLITVTPAPTCQNVRLSLKTDNYASETSWNIKNSAGTVMFSGALYSNNQTYTENFCLDPGCYTFTILDSYGDGICCSYGNGSYSLTNLSTSVVYKTGGSFGSSETTNFCIQQQSGPLANFTADNTSIMVGGAVQFTDLSTNNPSSWNWTFAGATPNVSTAQIPTVTYLTAGTFAVTLTVSNAYGANTKTVAGYITVTAQGNCQDIQLTLTTDNYGSETSWVIKDNTGAVIHSGSGYASNQTYTETFCLAEACYDFIIYDQYGDGICCSYGNGNYNLTNLTTSQVIKSGGTFGASETTNFCIGGVVVIIPEYTMSTKTVTDCSGFLYDSGNKLGKYLKNEDYTFTISPAGAGFVTMQFTYWQLESGYDFLYIYNGTSTSAPLIGSYSATSPGTVVASSGSMTLRFDSDNSIQKNGWEANWVCNNGEPNPDLKTEIETIVIDETSVKLYPNPTSSAFCLEFEQTVNNNEYFVITVFDMTGKIIHRQENNVSSGDRLMLDLSNQSAGLYFVQIQSDVTIVTKKVTKE